jgi:hypothetical protein
VENIGKAAPRQAAHDADECLILSVHHELSAEPVPWGSLLIRERTFGP